MRTEKITYQAGGETCVGYLAYTENTGNKPCVMIVPAFEGLNDFVKDYANKIAELGYVGFAIDIYGEGRTGHDLETCMGYAMNLFQNRQLIRDRMLDTFSFAKTLPQVDENRIAAIGFCLGGLCCLDLARSGADINGVASFHGALMPSGLEDKAVTAQMLVMTGYDDPQVPPEQVQAFCEEMKAYDFQLIVYSNTKHAYTDPKAHEIGLAEMGREYNAKTTARAWQACKQFLADLFQ